MKFVAALAIAFLTFAAWGDAQPPPKRPRLGVLEHALVGSVGRLALLDGLRDLGYPDGQNVVIEYRAPLSYGPNLVRTYRRMATSVDKLLRCRLPS